MSDYTANIRINNKKAATRIIKKTAVRLHFFPLCILSNLSDDDCINVYDPKNRIFDRGIYFSLNIYAFMRFLIMHSIFYIFYFNKKNNKTKQNQTANFLFLSFILKFCWFVAYYCCCRCC